MVGHVRQMISCCSFLEEKGLKDVDLVRPKVEIGKSWSLGRDWRVELESSAHTDLCGSNLGKSSLDLSVHLAGDDGTACLGSCGA